MPTTEAVPKKYKAFVRRELLHAKIESDGALLDGRRKAQGNPIAEWWYIQTIQLLVDGYREAGIAKLYGISPETLRQRLKVERNRRGVRTLYQLIAIYMREDLIW